MLVSLDVFVKESHGSEDTAEQQKGNLILQSGLKEQATCKQEAQSKYSEVRGTQVHT
jgi:hypothetical protein